APAAPTGSGQQTAPAHQHGLLRRPPGQVPAPARPPGDGGPVATAKPCSVAFRSRTSPVAGRLTSSSYRRQREHVMAVPALPPHAADRNLLLGILALQMDFISRDALITAMHAWVLEKANTLGQILREQGALTEDEHALLEALVEKHLRKHGDDPEKSLAAVGPVGSVRDELRRLADPDLDASLARVGQVPGPEEHTGSTVEHVGV